MRFGCPNKVVFQRQWKAFSFTTRFFHHSHQHSPILTDAHMANFYQVVSFLDFSLAAKYTKCASKVRKYGLEMREITPKWRIDLSYDVEHAKKKKKAQDFFDSNFGSKFQFSQPGWYPDLAIKILPYLFYIGGVRARIQSSKSSTHPNLSQFRRRNGSPTCDPPDEERKNSPWKWTTAEVCNWLIGLNYGQYIPVFEKYQVRKILIYNTKHFVSHKNWKSCKQFLQPGEGIVFLKFEILKRVVRGYRKNKTCLLTNHQDIFFAFFFRFFFGVKKQVVINWESMCKQCWWWSQNAVVF